MKQLNDDFPVRRLRAAFELFELAEAILRQNVRRENPQAGEDEIARRIGDWRRRRPEHGAEEPDLRSRP